MDDFQSIFGISGTDAAELWLWGWSSVVVSYLFGWTARVCVQLIRQL